MESESQRDETPARESEEQNQSEPKVGPSGEKRNQEAGGDQPGGVGSESGASRQGPVGGQLRKILRHQFAMQMETMIPEDIQRVLDQLEQRLESLRNSEDVQFADKAVKRIQLSARMLKAWGDGSFTIPWKSLSATAGCIFYLINPGDILPNMLKGEGDEALLDDALVLYLTNTLLEQDLRRFMKEHDLNPEDYGFSNRFSAF